MLNKINIIKQLYFSESNSCAELSKQLNKSLPNMAKSIDELVQKEIVIETGLAPSTGGRRALTYALKPDNFYIISVSVDQLYTKIALLNLNNEPIFTPEKFSAPLKDDSKFLEIISKKIEQMILKSGIEKSKILGVGIGMPGFIDAKKGKNFSFPFFTGKFDNIVDFLTDQLSLPVFIDNDSSLIALAELRFGAAKKKKNVMVINMGWGVGLGIIINGEIYRGETGFAGEFSHIPLFTNNKLCSCGKTGCLETETSLLVLIEKAKEAIDSGRGTKIRKIAFESEEFAYEQIINFALEGDSLAVELLSEIGFKIGRGISILIHLINPELVVLSGKGSIAKHIWLAPIQQALNEFCIPKLSVNTKIAISELGVDAEQIGAAALVIENLKNKSIEEKLLLQIA